MPIGRYVLSSNRHLGRRSDGSAQWRLAMRSLVAASNVISGSTLSPFGMYWYLS